MTLYLEHFGLKEPPFRITPHTDFFFAGAQRGALLEALLYAIDHDEGIIKVSGEVGSGKTMLCRMVMEKLSTSLITVYLANPSLSRQDILWAIADELGLNLPAGARSNHLLRALQEKLVEVYAQGRRVVVLIDEAHAMPMESLEEIRLLSNLESRRHKLMQLVLFGQPELEQVLARPDMRQLRERITHHFTLEPLRYEDVRQYLDFRMRAAGYKGPEIFSPAAIKLIAASSLGLTRRINILADKCLLAAYANGRHEVTPREVRSAIADCAFAATLPRHKPSRWLWAAGGAFLTALLLLPLVLRTPQTLPPTETSEPSSADDSSFAMTSSVVAPSLPATALSSVDRPAPQSLLAQYLAASQPWLQNVANDRWFLQLDTIPDREPERVENLLQQLTTSGVDMAQVRVYHSSLSGQPRYGVIYGDFASRRQALHAIATLPPDLRARNPYPRPAVRLKPPSVRTEK